jgi:hypothetical protein
MGYVEWLRVRGCLKWTAMVLGVLFLIAAIVRITIVGKEDYAGWALSLKSDPGSHETETTLADGTHRVEIDDPAKGLRVVIDEHGSRKHIVIYDKTGKTSSELAHAAITMGDVSEHNLPDGKGTLTTVDTNGETDFLSYVIAGVVIAMIVATILGAPFARENDGHLETSLTKPVRRDVLAVRTILIDAAGIVTSLVAGVAFSLLVHLMFEVPHVTFAARDAVVVGVGIVAPLAWYAMLAAATASIRRGWGAVLGFAWPVCAIVVALSAIDPAGNALLTVLHDVGTVLAYIDPLTYTHFGTDSAPMAVAGKAADADGVKLGALAVLAVAYSSAAVLQWRRVEA